MIPNTYADWRLCIERDCAIPLTPDFIAARLTDLRNPQSQHTQQFVRLYGVPHHARVLGWFEHAAREQGIPNTPNV